MHHGASTRESSREAGRPGAKKGAKGDTVQTDWATQKVRQHVSIYMHAYSVLRTPQCERISFVLLFVRVMFYIRGSVAVLVLRVVCLVCCVVCCVPRVW